MVQGVLIKLAVVVRQRHLRARDINRTVLRFHWDEDGAKVSPVIRVVDPCGFGTFKTVEQSLTGIWIGIEESYEILLLNFFFSMRWS